MFGIYKFVIALVKLDVTNNANHMENEIDQS